MASRHLKQKMVLNYLKVKIIYTDNQDGGDDTVLDGRIAVEQVGSLGGLSIQQVGQSRQSNVRLFYNIR